MLEIGRGSAENREDCQGGRVPALAHTNPGLEAGSLSQPALPGWCERPVASGVWFT